ncbi:MAG: hypothetical protein EKK64_10185 [Neisseriaceae bacterium]|nr:MAG: hypothetical protein EKK64_10185 [Neisseriaceae bacterium]
MSKKAPVEKITVTVNGKQVVLDPENMKYNESTIGQFMSMESGWIDYLGKQLEYAQSEALVAKINEETKFSKKLIEGKDKGLSDNHAKALANADDDVVKAKLHHAERKQVVGHIKAHLLAWKENHENAQNRGHTIRTEMKMLNRDIYDGDNESGDKEFDAEEFINNGCKGL